MPYDFNWHDDAHSIIRIDIHGKVTWDEWYIVNDQIRAEIAQAAPKRVDLIFNDSVGMPPGNPMPHMRATTAKLNTLTNLGTVVSVAPPHLTGIIKMILNIVIRMSNVITGNRSAGYFVSTVDEAIKTIDADRAKSQSAV